MRAKFLKVFGEGLHKTPRKLLSWNDQRAGIIRHDVGG